MRMELTKYKLYLKDTDELIGMYDSEEDAWISLFYAELRKKLEQDKPFIFGKYANSSVFRFYFANKDNYSIKKVLFLEEEIK